MSTTPLGAASIVQKDAAPQKEPLKVKATTKEAPKQRPKPKPAAKPTKILPTERINISKQLDILRAWAAASGPMMKVVRNDDVAAIVKMQPSTVSMCNAFFASTGLLVKSEGGYVPGAEVIAFLRHYEWSPETAAQKLAPVLTRMWFAEALLSKLSFRPLSEDECIKNLAEAAAAAPEYRSQLRVLLDYLAVAGLIQKDGNVIKKGGTEVTATATAEPVPAPKLDTPTQDVPKAVSPTLFGTTEGAVQFNVSVKVGMGEFASWEPQRIAAFFNGIAQVLAAKADVEKGE